MSITQYLTEEHRKCDTYYAKAEESVMDGNWEEAEKSFNTFKEKTLLHFQKEEELLFPRFEEVSGMTMGPTQVMRMEHAQARELLDKLEEALKNKDKDTFLSVGESLNILIQQHNMKEEQILYPMTDQNLDPGKTVEELSKMGEV